MADATKAAKVNRLSGPTLRREAGVALTHGEFVYIYTDDTVLLSDADAQGSAGYTLGPVVSHLPNEAGDTSVSDGEQVDIALPGSVVRGWTDLVTGTHYCVSTNSGEICPESDLATGDYRVVCGVALNELDLLVQPAIWPTTTVA